MVMNQRYKIFYTCIVINLLYYLSLVIVFIAKLCVIYLDKKLFHINKQQNRVFRKLKRAYINSIGLIIALDSCVFQVQRWINKIKELQFIFYFLFQLILYILFDFDFMEKKWRHLALSFSLGGKTYLNIKICNFK